MKTAATDPLPYRVRMRAMSDLHASVIGAGLAGSEAAWQLAEKGIRVSLYEMKPEKHSPAHHTDQFAELVCSNSFRGDRLSNAVGLLKEEMRRLDSLVMRWAERTRVPAGDALAVDRDAFSSGITVLLRVDPRWRLPTRRWVRSALLDPLQGVRLQRHAVDLAAAQHREFIVHDEVRGHLVLGQALQ